MFCYNKLVNEHRNKIEIAKLVRYIDICLNKREFFYFIALELSLPSKWNFQLKKTTNIHLHTHIISTHRNSYQMTKLTSVMSSKS